MFETIDLTQVVVTLIGILALVLTRYIVPFIKAKLGADKANDLAYWAGVAVTAVEEAARAGRIAKGDKFAEAVKFLEGKGFTLDEVELGMVIDSAVWKLINQFKIEGEADV